MKQAFCLIPLLLVSCVGQVKQAADGSVTVNLPFAARADRFAVNSNDGHGKTLKVLVVNGNAEAVPTAVITALGAAYGLHQATIVNGQNNFKDIANGVNGKTPTVLTTTNSDGSVIQSVAKIKPVIPKR